jgi:hypothetical protein
MFKEILIVALLVAASCAMTAAFAFALVSGINGILFVGGALAAGIAVALA